MARSVYLDNNATTPLKPEAIGLMAEVLAETGNATAPHAAGRQARAHVETARERVADLVGVVPNQVVFNSGATEANNTVLAAFRGRRILRPGRQGEGQHENGAAKEATTQLAKHNGVHRGVPCLGPLCDRHAPARFRAPVGLRLWSPL